MTEEQRDALSECAHFMTTMSDELEQAITLLRLAKAFKGYVGGPLTADAVSRMTDDSVAFVVTRAREIRDAALAALGEST